MAKETVKEYKDKDLTIVWKPHKCIHSGICTGLLPKVYKPEERPWIKTGKASTNKLKDQLQQCPSGALSYYMHDRDDAENPKIKKAFVEIKALEDGPLAISGNVEVIDVSGNSEKHTKVALCRCGKSGNKPYCDGSHVD